MPPQSRASGSFIRRHISVQKKWNLSMKEIEVERERVREREKWNRQKERERLREKERKTRDIEREREMGNQMNARKMYV